MYADDEFVGAYYSTVNIADNKQSRRSYCGLQKVCHVYNNASTAPIIINHKYIR